MSADAYFLSGSAGATISTSTSYTFTAIETFAGPVVANQAQIQVGAGPFDGTTAGFFTSTNGAAVGVNTPAGSNLDMAAFECGGVPRVKIIPWFTSGAWIDIAAVAGSASGIGSGGTGSTVWLAYAGAGGQFYTGANAGDILIRGPATKALLLGHADSVGPDWTFRLTGDGAMVQATRTSSIPLIVKSMPGQTVDSFAVADSAVTERFGIRPTGAINGWLATACTSNFAFTNVASGFLAGNVLRGYIRITANASGVAANNRLCAVNWPAPLPSFPALPIMVITPLGGGGANAWYGDTSLTLLPPVGIPWAENNGGNGWFLNCTGALAANGIYGFMYVAIW